MRFKICILVGNADEKSHSHRKKADRKGRLRVLCTATVQTKNAQDFKRSVIFFYFEFTGWV